jgi:hypothetical protein
MEALAALAEHAAGRDAILRDGGGVHAAGTVMTPTSSTRAKIAAATTCRLLAADAAGYPAFEARPDVVEKLAELLADQATASAAVAALVPLTRVASARIVMQARGTIAQELMRLLQTESISDKNNASTVLRAVGGAHLAAAAGAVLPANVDKVLHTMLATLV